MPAAPNRKSRNRHNERGKSDNRLEHESHSDNRHDKNHKSDNRPSSASHTRQTSPRNHRPSRKSHTRSANNKRSPSLLRSCLSSLHRLVFKKFIYLYDAGFFGLFYALKAMIALLISGAISYALFGTSVLIWAVMMAMYVFFLNGFKSNRDMDWKYLILFVLFVCGLIPLFGIWDNSLWLTLPAMLIAFGIGFSEVVDSDLPKVLTLALISALVANIYATSHPEVPLWHCMVAAFVGGGVSIIVRLYVSFGEYGRFIQTQFVAMLFEIATMSENLGTRHYENLKSQALNHISLLKSKLTSQSARIKDSHLIKNHKRALFYLYKLESICYSLDLMHYHFLQSPSHKLRALKNEMTSNLNELAQIFYGRKPHIRKQHYMEALKHALEADSKVADSQVVDFKEVDSQVRDLKQDSIHTESKRAQSHHKESSPADSHHRAFHTHAQSHQTRQNTKQDSKQEASVDSTPSTPPPYLNALTIFYSKIKGFTRISSMRSHAFVESSPHKDFREIAASLKSDPSPLHYGVRYAVAIGLAFFFAQFFQINHGAWIGVGVITMMHPHIGTIKNLAKDSILGSFVGLVVGVALVVLAWDSTLLRVIFVLNLFLVIYFKSYPFVLWSGVLMLELVLMFALVDSNFVELIAFRFFDISLGFVFAFCVSKILYPRYSAYELLPQIQKLLRDSNALLRLESENLNAQSKLSASLDELSALIKQSQADKKYYSPAQLSSFSHLLRDFYALKESLFALSEKLANTESNDLLHNDLKLLQLRNNLLCDMIDSKPYYFREQEDFLLKDSEILPFIHAICSLQNHIYTFLHDEIGR